MLDGQNNIFDAISHFCCNEFMQQIFLINVSALLELIPTKYNASRDTYDLSKVQISKSTTINSVDFSNLSFGEIFTDHMLVCDFIDGKWDNLRIIPYQNISIDPSTSALHYGQAIFEGMKAYKDDNDKVWLFRPKDNFNRFNKSCERMKIPEISEEYFMNGLKKLVSLDSNWVKPGQGNSLYIRPFVFASQATVQASPSKEYKFIVICSPAKSYYNESKFNVLIAEDYSRAANCLLYTSPSPRDKRQSRMAACG